MKNAAAKTAGNFPLATAVPTAEKVRTGESRMAQTKNP